MEFPSRILDKISIEFSEEETEDELQIIMKVCEKWKRFPKE